MPIQHFKTPYKSPVTATNSLDVAKAFASGGLTYNSGPKPPVSKPFVPGQPSQRASYAQAMNRAQRNGGSNGIGVGY